MSYEEHRDMVEKVQRAFYQSYCISQEDGFCIVWPVEVAPIIAKGKSPKKAWKAAAKLIQGKSKRQIEKLRRSLVEQEAKKGLIG